MQAVNQMWVGSCGEKVVQDDGDGYEAFRCMFGKEALISLAFCVSVGYEVRYEPCEINVGGRGGAIHITKEAANCA